MNEFLETVISMAIFIGGIAGFYLLGFLVMVVKTIVYEIKERRARD